MNVGQILETHLGWACAGLGKKVGKLVEEYRKSSDTKELRAMLHELYGDNDKNERVAEFDDEAVVRLGEQLTPGVPMATPVFDGAKEEDIVRLLESAGLHHSGSRSCMTGAPASRSIAR
jgi:DNA-directed RNA polymerase subunit beta